VRKPSVLQKTPRDSVSLKAQMLRMSPVSEGIHLKDSLPEKRLNEKHEGTEDPSGLCHNHSANTFPGALLKDKHRALGVQGRAMLSEVL
jgi:hypothetical protein